ncbi:MAG TPA: hypothetical protein VIS29_00885 [Streptomyces sp.]
MLKHYYRLVYWYRRLRPGTRSPGRRRGSLLRADLLRTDRVRPFVVFAVLVLITLAVSYVLGIWTTAGTGVR